MPTWRVLLGLSVILALVSLFLFSTGSSRAAATIHVDAANACPGSGTLVDPYCTIQLGVNAAAAGDTVSVRPGTYVDPVDIASRTNISIVGADKNTVILKPATTLCFNVSTYGCSRRAAIRIVSSTGINVSAITLDMDTVKGNFIHGFLVWDSTGSASNSIYKNNSVSDASGGYYEIMMYVRAPGYTDAARANFAVTGGNFLEAGRVGVVTHDYVNATIQGNTFTKTLNDFGYAMEIGSVYEATVSGNTISGYDTPALSDGSASAGIYIENAFTTASPPTVKDVSVIGNNISGSQFGMWIGNGYDGFAGPVGIVATLQGNNVHDNTDAGILVEDEDASAGSSVTLSSAADTVVNNGPVGWWLNTYGDGELHVNITNGTIGGQDYGVLVQDWATGPSTSTYDVSANFNSIVGNVTFGIDNEVTALLNGECNWWGANSGPSGAGPGTGDASSTNVDFDPWLASAGASCGGGPLAVGGILGLVDSQSAHAPQAPSQGQSSDGSTAGVLAALGVLITVLCSAAWVLRRKIGA
ncbi:MAG TPA: right-handed parallel beta-helix repeat-containing protein [Dehalococcoidia bacterium]|nr:right-handed parallel beta-helix repeat-containing protein [Dehalococcoidia bacterium]